MISVITNENGVVENVAVGVVPPQCVGENCNIYTYDLPGAPVSPGDTRDEAGKYWRTNLEDENAEPELIFDENAPIEND